MNAILVQHHLEMALIGLQKTEAAGCLIEAVSNARWAREHFDKLLVELFGAAAETISEQVSDPRGAQ